MASLSNYVKSCPDLSLAVMRDRLESQYRVWLLARHLDTPGRGFVTVKELRHFVKHQRLFGLRSLERVITKDCIFWRRRGGLLYTVSLHKVAAALHVRLRACPTWLPLDAFTSMLKLRQVFVASFFAHKPRTIAIDTLAELTGRSRSTVIRYLDSEYITKTPNVMISRRDPRLAITPEMAQEGYFHGRVAGKTVLLKRMPNTYQTDLETAAFGQVRYQRLPASATPDGDFDRRYFHHPKGARRALQALQPYHSLYLLSGNCFDDLGNQIWRGRWCLYPDAPDLPM